MSLEAAITSLEATIKTLITVMQSGAQVVEAAAPAATATVETSKPKVEKPKMKFIHIEKNRTVAEIKPGDTMPSIEGTVEIGKAEFERLKAEYSKPVETAATSFKTVVEKITELSKLTGTGRGREGVKTILGHFLPGKDGVRVPDLEPLGKHDEIIAAAQALIDTGVLPGAAAEAEEDLGL